MVCSLECRKVDSDEAHWEPSQGSVLSGNYSLQLAHGPAGFRCNGTVTQPTWALVPRIPFTSQALMKVIVHGHSTSNSGCTERKSPGVGSGTWIYDYTHFYVFELASTTGCPSAAAGSQGTRARHATSSTSCIGSLGGCRSTALPNESRSELRIALWKVLLALSESRSESFYCVRIHSRGGSSVVLGRCGSNYGDVCMP